MQSNHLYYGRGSLLANLATNLHRFVEICPKAESSLRQSSASRLEGPALPWVFIACFRTGLALILSSEKLQLCHARSLRLMVLLFDPSSVFFAQLRVKCGSIIQRVRDISDLSVSTAIRERKLKGFGELFPCLVLTEREGLKGLKNFTSKKVRIKREPHRPFALMSSRASWSVVVELLEKISPSGRLKFWIYLDIVENVIHQVCNQVSDFVVS